jgi:hypothetical protein
MKNKLDHVRKALSDTVKKARGDIENSHRLNRVPADYSLGFTNGLIFCDHHINQRFGDPKFYDRTTSIGYLPKPVVLVNKDDNRMGAADIRQFLEADVLIQARGLATSGKFGQETFEINDSFLVGLRALYKAIVKLDSFNEGAKEDVQQEAKESKPYDNAKPQDESSPLPQD